MNSEDVWVGAIPYLRTVDDYYSSDSKWVSSFTYSEAEERISDAGISIGSLLSVSVNEKTDYDAVLSLILHGTEADAVISKSQMKSIFSLKSQFFDIVGQDSGSVFLKLPSAVYITDGTEPLEKVSSTELYISDGDSCVDCKSYNGNGPVIITEDTAEYNPELITFSGKGSGHGVGMSQTGAKSMADLGFTYDEILKYYYTGIEIEDYERQ